METILIYPENGATLSLHTDLQQAFCDREDKDKPIAAVDWLALKRSEKEDGTFPRPVMFRWISGEGISLFEIAQRCDFSDAKRIQTVENEIGLQNLLIGTTYYWRVNGSEIQSFTTDATPPRWIFADGLSNLRDNGGWTTADGRKTRQNILFRGTEMDVHHQIQPAGKWVLTEDLKIKTDLDLRRENIGSPLGDKVTHREVYALAYDHFVRDKATCKALFDILAEAENYPIYLHCWGGADRTGTIFFILNAMLGVAEEDLLLDYELTSLSIWGDRSRHSDLFRDLMAALDDYGAAGDSINQKAVRFLRACGIGEAQLEKIKAILVE